MQRFLFLGLFLFSFLSSNAWSAVTASPSHSTTGSFTLSWPAASGLSFIVQENGSTIYYDTGNQLPISGRSQGMYDYKVMSYDANCVWCLPIPIGYVTVTVSIAAPGTPGSLSVPSSTTTGNYTVSWGASAGSIESYTLQERYNGGSWSTVQNSTSRSKTFSKSANRYYDYRVRACNQGLCSGYSASKRITIPAGSVTATASPSTLSYTTDTVTLNWNSVMATGCSWTGASISGTSGSKSAVLSSWFFDDSYFNLWVRDTSVTCNVKGGGTVTRAIKHFANKIPTKPLVNAVWNANSAYVGQSKTLTWSTDETTSCSLDGQSVSPNSSKTYTFSTNGTVNKTVTCTNALGSTSSSDSITVAYSTPGVPGGISATSTTNSISYSVSWGAASGAVTAYQLQERANGGSWATVQSSTSRSDSYTKAHNNYYDYRVRACNHNACSAYTSNRRVSIAKASVSLTVSSSILALTNNTVSLSWNSVMTSSCSGSGEPLSGTSGSRSTTLSGWSYNSSAQVWNRSVSISCNIIGGGSVSDSVTIVALAEPPKPTVNVSWDDASAYAGEASTLQWTTSDADSCRLDNVAVGVNSSQPFTFTDSGVKTKTVTCTNEQGDTSASDSISIAYRAPSTPGLMTWQQGNDALSYSVSWPASSGTTTAYELRERATGGAWATIQNSTSRSASFRKTVNSAFDYQVRACNHSVCSGYSIPVTVTMPDASVTVTSNISTALVTNQLITLNWQSEMTTNCTSGDISVTGTNGSYSGVLSDWTYRAETQLLFKNITVTCDVIDGGSVSGSYTVTADEEPMPIVTASWNASSVLIDSSATFTWNSTYSANCSVNEDRNNDGVNDTIALSGSQEITLSVGGTLEKIVTCTNTRGQASASASIEVTVPPKPVVTSSWDKSTVAMGGEATFSWSSTGADSCEYGNTNIAFSGSLPVNDFTFIGNVTRAITCRNRGGDRLASASIQVSRPTFEFSTNDPVSDALIGTEYLGLTVGEHSIDKNGGFNYSVPIAMPPGINGMQPDIKLGYNSTAQNGLMGWGWNISGLSSITRCAASMARDGYVSGISTGDSYKFCLDGQRLVKLANGEYRTESETFKRITKYASHWLVESPDGSKAYYGVESYTNATIVDGVDVAISWNRDKQEDVSGNYITYVYDTDATSASVAIKEIQYTKNDSAQGINNTVEFFYEERSDITSGYSANTLFNVDKRLSRIETKANGTLVYLYEIHYEVMDGVAYADPSNTSRVASIKKCYTGSSACAEPLVFEWTSTHRDNYILDENDVEYVIDEDIAEEHYFPEDGLTSNVIIGGVVPASAGGRRALRVSGVRGDFDGDNKLEVIWGGGSRWVAMEAGDEGAWFADLEPEPTQDDIANGFNRSLPGMALDFNGDGLDDYYVKRRTSINVYISDGTTLHHSDGYSMTKEELGIIHGTVCCELGDTVSQDWLYNYVIQDVDGDNRVDILRMPLWDTPADRATISDLGITDISVAHNNGGGFDDFEQWATSTDFTFLNKLVSDSYLSVADVNGDQLVDLVGLDGQVGINTGSTFIFDASWADEINLPVMPADSFIYVNTATLPVEISSGISGGTAGVGDHVPGYDEGQTGTKIPRSSFSPFASVTRVADVNGDGLVDIVAVRWDGVYVALSTGATFLSAEMWTDALTYHDLKPYCNMMECSTARRTFNLQDANRDGMADILYTRAWMDIRNKDASDVIALYSKGRVDAAGAGFSDPITIASIDPLPDSMPADEAKATRNERIGKPLVTEEGDLVIHRQAGFGDALAPMGIPLIESFDVAVKIGVNPHQILAVNESNARSLSITYKKLSDSEVYIQTGGKREDSKISSRYPATYADYGNDNSTTIMPDHSLPSAARGLQVAASLKVYENNTLATQDDYFYKNRRTHRLGLGSLGFEEVQKTTTLSGQTQKIRTVSDYLQEVGPDSNYLLVAPSKTTQCVIANVNAEGCETATGTTLLSEHKQSWKVRVYDDGSSPRFHSYALEEETKNYDLTTGTWVNTISKRLYDDSVRTSCPALSDITSDNRTTTTDDHFDAYGTPLDSVENRCDTFGVTGTYTDNDNILNDTGNWCLNLTQDPKVTRWNYDSEGGTTDSITRHTNFTYFSSGQQKCRTETETREPTGSNDIWLQKTYGYNAYGSQTSITETVKAFTNDGIDFTSRTASIAETYNSDGVRTLVTTNALGHNTTQTFNAAFGSVERLTDANDLVSDYFYDVAGRLNYAEQLGVVTTYDYRTCDSCFDYNNTAAHYVQEKTEGQSAKRVYFDALNREVGKRWRGLNGTFYYSGQKYNALGLSQYGTEPFGDLADTSALETEVIYDVLGRPVQTDFASGASQRVVYSVIDGAASVTTTDSLLNTKEQQYDALGREKSVTDALGIIVSYKHDALGSVTDIRVAADTEGTNAIDHKIVFDEMGRKIELIDPDIGSIKYTYNAFGKLTAQLNSEDERICYFYDALGRQTARYDNASATCTGGLQQHWTFDREGELGLLAEVNGRDTRNQIQSEVYQYTLDYLLPENVTSVIDGESFTVTNYYDVFHRPTGVSYPTGFTLTNKFNDYGIPYQSVNALTDEVLWSATEDDARGNVTEATYGNGASVSSVFKANNGLLETREASLNGVSLQNHAYTFDDEGNLRSREDRRTFITQSFCYDPLYRLTDQVVNDSCTDDVNGSYSGTAYAYDIHGNITRKDGIEDYVYGGAVQNAGPHAVSFANGGDFIYDDAGRMIGSPFERTLAYSAFGKPTYMGIVGTYETSIVYGAMQRRVQREDFENGQTTDTLYIGKQYERIDTPDGKREHRHYMGDWGIHIITEDNSVTDDYNIYLTRDHIGSIASKSDDRDEETIKYHANEPWGQRQDEDWAGEVYAKLSGEDLKEMTFGTTRGFTDHEHLDGVGLIHMNGRVYDPVVGRFVSPDPWIQDATNSQSFNRYTYVWNNPLRYTDPTGEITTDCGRCSIITFGSSGSSDSAQPTFSATYTKNDAGEITGITITVAGKEVTLAAVEMVSSEGEDTIQVRIQYSVSQTSQAGGSQVTGFNLGAKADPVSVDNAGDGGDIEEVVVTGQSKTGAKLPKGANWAIPAINWSSPYKTYEKAAKILDGLLANADNADGKKIEHGGIVITVNIGGTDTSFLSNLVSSNHRDGVFWKLGGINSDLSARGLTLKEFGLFHTHPDSFKFSRKDRASAGLFQKGLGSIFRGLYMRRTGSSDLRVYRPGLPKNGVVCGNYSC